jgi:hypothetical protein
MRREVGDKMPVRIEIFDKVKESDLIVFIKEFGDDGAKFVTGFNDNQGSFSVEATIVTAPAAGGTGQATITLEGLMSTFGGPHDPGVGNAEGLSLFDSSDIGANPDLFLPAQPPGTTGLAKRLNPDAKYLACRWDLHVTPKSFLRTIKVKVTNPANGRTFEARPADTGPAVFTGRTADLSPGLATALGLGTDHKCVVEIPTPAGAQQPAPPPADVEGIVLSDIDPVFGPGMVRTLAVVTTTDKAVYWVVNKIGDNDGGQSLFRHVGNQTEVLLSDATVFPVAASDKVPADIAFELNKVMPNRLPPEATPAGNPPQVGDDINAKMFTGAVNFVDQKTGSDPRTNGGGLACAWAVNEVARRALGKPISTEDGRNGVGTGVLFDVLKAHHTQLGSASDAKPGTIIIAPQTPSTHGHVGIVGTTTSSVDATDVFSNSSNDKKFEKNYTIKKFTDTFRGKGLQVLFFALKQDQF